MKLDLEIPSSVWSFLKEYTRLGDRYMSKDIMRDFISVAVEEKMMQLKKSKHKASATEI